MAVELLQEGAAIPFTSGVDLASGSVVVQSSLVGVNKRILRAGRPGVLHVSGVFAFPKTVGVATAMNPGTLVFWNGSIVTPVDSGALPQVGKVTQRAEDADSKASVLILLRQGPKPFVPADLPNLLLWLDAADGTTLDASSDFDPVGLWQDKSGGGRDCVQITAGFKPTLFTNQQNGLPAVFSDGSDDYMPCSFREQSGTNTGTSNKELIDSGATFLSDNIATGDRVFNDSDSTETIVDKVNSDTSVDLAVDIFTTTPKDYTIRRMGDEPDFELDSLTILAVVKRVSLSDSGIFVFQEQTRSADKLVGIIFDISGNKIRFNVSDGGSLQGPSGSTILSSGTFQSFSAVKNGVNGEVFINGVSDATGAMPATVTYSPFTTKRSGIMSLFDNNSGNQQWFVSLDGYLAELLVYGDAKGAGDLSKLDNYVQAKWGLP